MSMEYSFQSSPCPRARCYAAVNAWIPGVYAFQSSPCPRARCYYLAVGIVTILEHVSILTLPEGKVLRPKLLAHRCLFKRVSILTLPEGKVLPACASSPVPRLFTFQSSPCPRARCYIHGRPSRDQLLRFQSSPCPRARCYKRR